MGRYREGRRRFPAAPLPGRGAAGSRSRRRRFGGPGRQVAQHRQDPRATLPPSRCFTLCTCTAKRRRRSSRAAPPRGRRPPYRSGDVGPEVAAFVDAGQHPRRFRAEAVQRHAHAVGRRRLDGEPVRADLSHADEGVGRDAVAAAGMRADRGDDDHLADLAGGLFQGGRRPGPSMPSSLVRTNLIFSAYQGCVFFRVSRRRHSANSFPTPLACRTFGLCGTGEDAQAAQAEQRLAYALRVRHEVAHGVNPRPTVPQLLLQSVAGFLPEAKGLH